MFDQNWIAAHIPHQGSMCLLEVIEYWDQTEIICRTSSHRLVDNPLLSNGKLGITNGIEYAAQAMAAHGSLLAIGNETASVGFLTSVRDVKWHRLRLDNVENDLTVCAERISGNEVNVLYKFRIHAQGITLLTGRASVMLNAEGL